MVRSSDSDRIYELSHANDIRNFELYVYESDFPNELSIQAIEKDTSRGNSTSTSLTSTQSNHDHTDFSRQQVHRCFNLSTALRAITH